MEVIKIGAAWCTGCLVMRPRWKKIEEKYPWLITKNYDFDEDKKYIDNHSIDVKLLPTFIFIDKIGNELHRVSGEVSEKKLIDLITKYKDY